MKTTHRLTKFAISVLFLSIFYLLTGCGGNEKVTDKGTTSLSQSESTMSHDSDQETSVNSEADTAIDSDHQKTTLDLGEKIIAKEFSTDLGKDTAKDADYIITNENDGSYDCQNQIGESIFTCRKYNNNIQYSMSESNDILTIFGILPGDDIDDATITLEKHAFECTVDAAYGDDYYRYYYVYATDTILYEVGLHYNPDTMEITTSEISLLDNTEY